MIIFRNNYYADISLFCSLYWLHIIIFIITTFFGDFILLKKLLPCILLTAMSFAHAANETSSIRTPEGQLISLGDTFTDMQNRLKLSPNSMITHEFKEGKNLDLAMDYKYEIENMMYTITIVNDRVRKIEWLNTHQEIKDKLTQ